LKGHIVIIDEAHNLMDAISGMHSISVSLEQLQRSRAQLMIYLQKFRNRLAGKNRVYVTQTVRLLDSLIGYLHGRAASSHATEDVVQPGDLMAGKGVDQVNLYKLTRYLQESKLARKVDGYVAFSDDQQEQQPGSHNGASGRLNRSVATIPTLSHIQSFLLSLMNPSVEGRFFFSKTESDISLRYMLLDPTEHFKDIVDEARAVVLAGGTMSPVSIPSSSSTLI